MAQSKKSSRNNFRKFFGDFDTEVVRHGNKKVRKQENGRYSSPPTDRPDSDPLRPGAQVSPTRLPPRLLPLQAEGPTWRDRRSPKCPSAAATMVSDHYSLWSPRKSPQRGRGSSFDKRKTHTSVPGTSPTLSPDSEGPRSRGVVPEATRGLLEGESMIIPQVQRWAKNRNRWDTKSSDQP